MSKSPTWLKNAIFYQIYPQSFYDSNGDGIGDLFGINQKLDYIQSLGCNAIWLNPIFESPFLDAGYDVSDFYKIAPRYGTKKDLKDLLKEVHKRDMKLCLDLVPAHTSIHHKWFTESCKAKKNKYSNWYIWTDNPWKKIDSTLSAIHGYGQRHGNYIASFFWSQPALNFGFANPTESWQLPPDHPDVKALKRELINIMRYWMDLGVDGYRVDMAGTMVKQDPKWKKTIAFWKEVRAMMDKDYPDNVLIAEWAKPSAAIKAGFHADFLLAFHDDAYQSLLRKESERDIFGFYNGHSFFDKAGKGDITEFLNFYVKEYKATKTNGYISITTGNHDLSRIRLGRTLKEMEIIFAFILTMPGVPFIYYGDEIGMETTQGLPSKEGGYSRTGVRTPMQWNTKRNAGFSTAPAKDLYLPVSKKAKQVNVKSSLDQKSSLLKKVQTLIDLRKSCPALGSEGTFKVIYAEKKRYPFVYQREFGKDRFLISLNPAGRKTTALMDIIVKPDKLKRLAGYGQTINTVKNGLQLICGPISYSIWQLQQ